MPRPIKSDISALADQIGDSPDLARLLNHLAATQRRQGRRAEAHATFQRALKAAWSGYERGRAEQGIADTAADAASEL